MISYSHGTMPPRDLFNAAFERECPRGFYSITLGAGRASDAMCAAEGSHTADELYSLISTLADDWEGMEDGDDCGAMVASDILSTLGFEWV